MTEEEEKLITLDLMYWQLLVESNPQVLTHAKWRVMASPFNKLVAQALSRPDSPWTFKPMSKQFYATISSFMLRLGSRRSTLDGAWCYVKGDVCRGRALRS